MTAPPPATAASAPETVACGQCRRAYRSPSEVPAAVIECPWCGAQARRDALGPPTAAPARSWAVWKGLLAAVLAVALVGGAGFGLRWLQPAPAQARPEAPAPAEDAAPVKTAILAEARAAASGALGSSDWTAAQPLLLEAGRLAPLMARYHARHPWTPISLVEEIGSELVLTGGRRSARLTMRTDRGTVLSLRLEETPDGWKLDWERLIQARHFAWEIFHEDAPGPPVFLHVTARRGSGTDAHFASAGLTPETAIAVRLEGPRPSRPGLAIVDKASDLGRLFQRELTWEQPRPYRCELRMADPALVPPRVEITAFIGEGWAGEVDEPTLTNDQ